MALLITPKIFKAFPEVQVGMTLRGNANLPYGFNLSEYIGDDPDRVMANRHKVAGKLGFDLEQLAFQKQVHGKTIVRVEEGYSPGESDGLVTDRAGWLLAISIADCVPVLFYDPEHCVVAGVHSGWRGSVQRIASNLVQYMHTVFGTRSEDLHAWIGPSAGLCCYEVGAEVASQFDECHSRSLGRGTFLLDNRGSVLADLLESGLDEKQIEVDIRCTICDERFHSYRRDRERSGRMSALIGMHK